MPSICLSSPEKHGGAAMITQLIYYYLGCRKSRFFVFLDQTDVPTDPGTHPENSTFTYSLLPFLFQITHATGHSRQATWSLSKLTATCLSLLVRNTTIRRTRRYELVAVVLLLTSRRKAPHPRIPEFDGPLHKHQYVPSTMTQVYT